MARFPAGQGLVIGVGSAGDPRWDMPIATRDAQDIYETLIDQEFAGYGRGAVELLCDEQATRAQILEALRRLADRSSSNPDSTVLISWTGVGLLGEDGLYYLATAETRFTGPSQEIIASGTGVHVGEIARALRDIPARRLLLIVNAGAAGRLAQALGDEARVTPDEAIAPAGQELPDAASAELLATGEGRAIVVACRADQQSYFSPDDRHSYFGQAVIDALKGAGIGNSGEYINLFDFFDSVYRQVRTVVMRRYERLQEPVLTVLAHAGPFPIAAYPGAVTQHTKRTNRGTAERVTPVRVGPTTSKQPPQTINKPAIPAADPLGGPLEIAMRILADRPSSDDLLGYGDFADAVVDFLSNERTEKPLVLAINAPWGMGKTTLMHMIEQRLNQWRRSGKALLHNALHFDADYKKAPLNGGGCERG